MRKISYLFIFFIICIFAFGENKQMEEIKNVIMRVEETLNVNGQKKISNYTLKYIKPDFIRKDILSPELNKGEVYIYDGDKKIVYLPLFQQKSEERVAPEENTILESIELILSDRKEEFKKGEKIVLDKNTELQLVKLKKYDGYTLPEICIIYDGNSEIGRLKIENYKINPDITKEELQLHD